MRFLTALAVGMSLCGAAQAVTLFEAEPNDCACEATPGGTIATSLLSGALTDGDFDYDRFDFAEAVPVFSVHGSAAHALHRQRRLAGQIDTETLGLGAYSVLVGANSVTTAEPASMALLAAGIAALAWRRRTA